MGTTSATILFADEGTEEKIVTVEQSMDGHPHVYGRELAEFLDGIVLVPGVGDYSDNEGKPLRIARGMECLAAQVIVHFKKGPGRLYMYPGNRLLDSPPNFIYKVWRDGWETRLSCDDRYKVLFSGTPADFLREFLIGDSDESTGQGTEERDSEATRTE